MMQIKVLFFGIARQITNESQISVTLSKATTVAGLKNFLYQKYSKLVELDCYMFAVNETYQNQDFVLKNDDVVALIPPVSGG